MQRSSRLTRGASEVVWIRVPALAEALLLIAPLKNRELRLCTPSLFEALSLLPGELRTYGGCDRRVDELAAVHAAKIVDKYARAQVCFKEFSGDAFQPGGPCMHRRHQKKEKGERERKERGKGEKKKRREKNPRQKRQILVPMQGLEPWTSRLRVCHSAN